MRNLSIRLATEEKERKIAQQRLLLLKKEKQVQAWLVWGLGASFLASLFLALFYLNRSRLLNTEKEALKERETARRKTEELQSFNYAVSHDLKFPLTNADQFLLLLKEQIGPQTGSRIHKYLDQFQQLIGEMKGMIDGLSSFAQADNLELRYTEVDTAALVRSVAGRIKREEAHNLHVEIRALPVLFGDPILLRQVFANLLSNAAKFTRHRADRAIIVSGTQASGQVEIKVTDNGAGFSPEGMHRLFQLFKTAHDRNHFEGAGVGLAVVKRIVERHGGSITAESEGPEKGATFVLVFPEGDRKSLERHG